MSLLSSFGEFPPYLYFLLILWSISWKGLALWKSAKNNNIYFFIAILILNTGGILPIIYIVYVEREEIKHIIKNIIKK